MVVATSSAGTAPISGPTIGMTSVSAAIRASRSAPGRPSSAVGDAGGEADRGHEEELARAPTRPAGLDLVPGVADAGPPVARREGEGVALESRALGQPEEDERQERHEGGPDVPDRERRAR